MNIVKNLSIAATGTLLVTLGTVGKAQAFVLNFENPSNTDNGSAVNEYTNLGVTLSSGAITSFDAYNSLTNTFLNEPSPKTALFFHNTGSLVLSYATGFTSFSFYYVTTNSPKSSFTVYSDVTPSSSGIISSGTIPTTSADSNGNALFAAQPITVNLSTPGKSIQFTGSDSSLGLDDISITPFVPVPPASSVPEPSSVLGILALGTLGAVSTLKRKFSQ